MDPFTQNRAGESITRALAGPEPAIWLHNPFSACLVMLMTGAKLRSEERCQPVFRDLQPEPGRV